MKFKVLLNIFLIEDGESELAQAYISYRVDRDLRRKINWISNGRYLD